MTALATGAVEHHPHRHAGPGLALNQAAQARRQPVRQHRLHPVGEVDGVALLPRLPVQGRARPDVGGHIGDGDPDDPAVGVLGIGVGLGEDGVVVVPRIRGIDGHQRQVAQVHAAGEGGGRGCLRLGLRGGGEAGGDAMGVDGDQRGGARVVLVAYHLDHAAGLGAVGALPAALHLGQHQVSIVQPRSVRAEQRQALLGSSVHGLDPDVSPALAHHAQHLMGALPKPLDQARLGLTRLQPHEPDQHPVAHAGRACRRSLFRGRQPHQRRVIPRLGQADIEVAVRIALDHVRDPDRRQGAGFGDPAPPALPQGSVRPHAPQHLAQRTPVAALQAEMAGDRRDVGFPGVADVMGERLAVGQASRRSGGRSGHGVSLADPLSRRLLARAQSAVSRGSERRLVGVLARRLRRRARRGRSDRLRRRRDGCSCRRRGFVRFLGARRRQGKVGRLGRRRPGRT